jgi:hypothetical protein
MRTSRNRHGGRKSVAVLITAVALVRAAPVASASTSSTVDPLRLSRLETLVFRMPIGDFTRIASRPAGVDSTFDWSTDHCSAPLVGSTGRSFDFTDACVRHDFAYRNYKRADAANQLRGRVWNSRTRHRIDMQFQRDMTNHCSQRKAADRPACRLWCEVFFRLVRVAGGP